MRLTLLPALAAGFCCISGCQQDPPGYELTIRLAGRDGGQGIPEVALKDNSDGPTTYNKASLKTFTCDVSIRLGQCVDAMPIQLVLVPAGENQSGSNSCGSRSANRVLQDNVGTEIPLGRGDGGLVWVQAFQGDDDDDSGLVDRREMNAYAELRHGTLRLEAYDADRLEGQITARDDDGSSYVVGRIGAIPNDDGRQPLVGPRCTWPIGARAN